MPQLTCSRCGATAEGLEQPPLPGEVGREVHDRVCKSCWHEWLQTQVKLINEYRLSPVNPEHYQFLIKEMRAHLQLNRE
jgi:Fe-S cluster biosynthesis and repair protein YggX